MIKVFIEENACEDVDCGMSAILPRGQSVNMLVSCEQFCDPRDIFDWFQIREFLCFFAMGKINMFRKYRAKNRAFFVILVGLFQFPYRSSTELYPVFGHYSRVGGSWWPVVPAALWRGVRDAAHHAPQNHYTSTHCEY